MAGMQLRIVEKSNGGGKIKRALQYQSPYFHNRIISSIFFSALKMSLLALKELEDLQTEQIFGGKFVLR